MFGVYVIGFVIAMAGTIIFTAVTFIEGWTNLTREQDERLGYILAFVGTLGAIIWPLIVPLALLSFLGYGGWTTARAIKHRSLNF